MKSLNTIIKIEKNHIEELRKQIVLCEEEIERLHDFSAKMSKELAEEYELVTKNPDFGATFENYRRKIKERQATIAKSVWDLNKRIENMKQEIADRFGEMKKYEILLEQKQAEAKEEQKQKETKQMDEIATRNG